MLGKSDDDMIRRVGKAQEHLYPTKIAADGTIMEWVRNLNLFMIWNLEENCSENFWLN